MAKKQKSAVPPAETSSDEYHLIPCPKHLHEEEEEEDDFEVSQASSEDDDQPPSPNSQPIKPTTSSDSETDSDSGSESDTPPNSKPKPLASKPMDQTPKPTKDNSTLKRPAKNIDDSANDPKRAKKKGTDAAAAAADDDDDGEVKDVKKTGGDSKKLFQRLWSEEDEIAILKGMVEFTSKVGQDPYKYADAFYDFMKKSLHAEASSNQLKEKIRRLKQKFEKNALRGKNGEDPNFSKPFDREVFELSRKVWGNAAAGGADGAVEKAKSDGKVAKSPKKGVRSTNVAPTKPELKLEVRSVDSNKDVKMDIGELTDTTSYLMEVIRVNKGVGLYGLSEDAIKRGMELIGASDRKELEEQWKELQAAELELSVKRVELVANHARLILEAYKSSNHH